MITTKSQSRNLQVSDKINNLGIKIKSYSDGEHLALCPWCSHTRKKKTIKCLSIRIDGEKFKFICHHCGKKGTENEGDRNTGTERAKPRNSGKIWRNNIQSKWY